MINGWLESTSLRLFDLVGQFEKKGLIYLACTDIRTDGMLMGPNFGLYENLKKQFPKLKLIASGGISSIADLIKLKSIKVDGAVIGKAIYEHRSSSRRPNEYGRTDSTVSSIKASRLNGSFS